MNKEVTKIDKVGTIGQFVSFWKAFPELFVALTFLKSQKDKEKQDGTPGHFTNSK
jgi:hypothetical protein